MVVEEATTKVKPRIRTKSQLAPDEAYEIKFYNKDNHVIGKLTFGRQSIEFEGEAKPSAKRFFEMYLKGFVDEYIRKKGKE
jgi:hypothetical protein